MAICRMVSRADVSAASSAKARPATTPRRVVGRVCPQKKRVTVAMADSGDGDVSGSELGSFAAGMGLERSSSTTTTVEPEEKEKAAEKKVFDDSNLVIESEKGVDYSELQRCLKAQEWELADNETRRLLCVLSSDDAAKRKWVYFSEVQYIPVTDFQTLDNLWSTYTGGRHGYTVQKKIWRSVKGRWGDFFKRIDWVTGENKAYRKWPEEFIWDVDSAQGHMPLTNALRGTQLFEAIMTHPAFDSVDEAMTQDFSAGGSGSGGGGAVDFFA